MILNFGVSDFKQSMPDLPLELVQSVFLEEDGDHGYILFKGIIGIIHARCEDSRLLLLKI